MIERFHPASFAPVAVPLSPATKAGGFVFVSGQVASRPDGSIHLGEFADEVNLVLDNVEAVLAAAGARPDQLVKVGAFLTNATLFGPFNEIYARRWGAAPPARTTIVVDFGRGDIRVEVEGIAWVG
ncbi:RidA family protein [Dactylosporangium sp. AC04546]|uniref:RidA family protein n=1 Tax=Dactylosporangium sp. AC04546 TaxID=2862460 RepID=UPI001EDFF043|nr:RidA family protein [Dactylosporangium sp. AC04546]WVK89363.1 RidA family protein [Dactylosporangium sp. AC04546]